MSITRNGIGPIILLAAIQHAAGQDTIVFRDVRVFDGTDVLQRTTVLVRAGRIAQIGGAVEVPPDALVIEGAGKTLLPGLIDCHTHTFGPEHLEQAAVFGVTTELDMFTDHRFAARMRSEQASGQAHHRADLFSSGTLVTAPGGHGTEYGFEIPTITGPEQAAEFVAARVAEGSDYIKIVYDTGKAWGLSFSTISRDTLGAVIEAAHAVGKLAIVHIGDDEGAHDAVNLGCDGLAHVFGDQPADRDLMKLMVERRPFVVPTLVVLESAYGVPGGKSLVDDADLAPFLLPGEAHHLSSGFARPSPSPEGVARAKETTRRFHTAGVTILVGTDAPNPGVAHGASIHRELELLVEAGLVPRQVIAGATSGAAERFGLKDRGRIAAGLRADLLLVEGDPTTDIKATRKIVGVWKEGRAIDRDAFRRRVAQAQEKVAQAKAAPPPPGSELGLVSDFEGDGAKTAFGGGWEVSTDAYMGGRSTAEFERAAGGAGGSQGSLLIKGTIDEGASARWGGAMFWPGAGPFAPANLSSKEALSFSAKGDGKSYSVMIFSEGRGFMPSMKTFVAGPEWTNHRFTLKSFDGCDGIGITGIFFGGGANPGPFSFQIDDVRFDARPGG